MLAAVSDLRSSAVFQLFTLRYQTLNGIDAAVAKILPVGAFTAYSAVIRTANNVAGGASFAFLARLFGVQKSSPAPEPAKGECRQEAFLSWPPKCVAVTWNAPAQIPPAARAPRRGRRRRPGRSRQNDHMHAYLPGAARAAIDNQCTYDFLCQLGFLSLFVGSKFHEVTIATIMWVTPWGMLALTANVWVVGVNRRAQRSYTHLGNQFPSQKKRS